MTNIDFNDIDKITERIVPATMLRRNFGEVSKKISSLGYVVLTVKGRPMFKVEKIIKADDKSGKSAREMLSKFYGIWKGTELDDDKFWHKILIDERIKGTRKKRIKW